MKKIYILGEKALLNELVKIKGIAVYSKSNIDDSYFELGVSDLDYVILSENNNVAESLSTVFVKINKRFPFIKDFDLYSEKDFLFLLEYGGVKFASPETWKLLVGESVLFPRYFFHPFKFACDQIDELYFYFLWLYENKQKNKSTYRTKVLKRTLAKIFQTISWLENPESFSKPRTNKYTSVQLNLIESVELESFGNDWLGYLETLDIIDSLRAAFPSKFERINKFYSEENNVINTGAYTFSSNQNIKNCVHVTNKLFDLFYFSGAISIDVLIETTKAYEDHIYGLCAKARLNCYLINGFSSDYTKKINQIQLESDILSLKKINHQFISPKSYVDKNVFVTVNWGRNEDRHKAFLRAKHFLLLQKGDFEQIHVDLNKSNVFGADLEPLKTDLVFIESNDDDLYLWQKEALFNWAYAFCFGCKNIIFSDAEVFSTNNSWIESIFSKLREYPFVQGFRKVSDTKDISYNSNSWVYNIKNGINNFKAQGLVWGLSREYFKQIESLPDHLNDGSNDSLFMEEVSGITMGVKEEASWYHRKKRKNIVTNYSYVDVDTVHINHGDTRHYVNRVEMMSLLAEKIESLYSKNSLGVYELNDLTSKDNELLFNRKYFFEYSKEKTLSMIKQFVNNKTIDVPSEFIIYFGLNHASVVNLKNCIGVVESKEDSFSIYTYSEKTENEEVHLKLDLGSIYFTEHRLVKVSIDTEAQILDASILCNWNTHKNSNDLNNLFFVNKREKEICFTTYTFEEKESVHLDIKFVRNTKSNPIKIKILENNSISVVHMWIPFTTLTRYEVNHNSLEFTFNLPPISMGTWWAYEICFESSVEGEYDTFVRFNESLPYDSCKREFKSSSSKEAKTIFYQSLYCMDQKIVINSNHEFLSKLENIQVKLFKRADLV